MSHAESRDYFGIMQLTRIFNFWTTMSVFLYRDTIVRQLQKRLQYRASQDNFKLVSSSTGSNLAVAARSFGQTAVYAS